MRTALAAAALAAALALAACGGDDEERVNVIEQARDDEPAAEATAERAPAEVEQPVSFLPANAIMRTNGCTTRMTFRWKAEDPGSVPDGAEAVIKVKGPRLSGTYRRAVRSGAVVLKLSTKVNRRTAKFRGRLVSVAGRPVSPDIPIEHPFLNTACGPNARPQSPSTLPPGTPVPGAPCVKGRPLPPGFQCK